MTLIFRALPYKKYSSYEFVNFLYRLYDTDKQVRKKVVLCPAMNTQMYNHPSTQDQFTYFKKQGFIIVDSIEKLLACNDFGKGAMEEPIKIFDAVKKLI